MSETFQWEFPEANEIDALHDEAIRLFGGTPGVLDKNCPEAKIAAAKNALLYGTPEDEEPELLRAAAQLLFYLTTGHCYVDGNKRVGWLAALRLLDINGIRLRGDDPEAPLLVNRVASNEATLEDVIAFLGRPERFYATPR